MSGKTTSIASWVAAEHENRSIEEAISELQRELQVRTRCYDRWVSEGRVSYIDARDRQERLFTAIRYLQTVHDLQGVDLPKA